MIPQRTSVTYTAWETCGVFRSDANQLLIYLPCASLREGSGYTANNVPYSIMPTGQSTGVVTGSLAAVGFVRAAPDVICIHYNRPSSINANLQGTFAVRENLTITAT